MRIAELIAAIEREGRAAVVLVAEAKGSVPREAGAAMLVTSTATAGTIGGGTVEHRAVARAREMLADGEPDTRLPGPPPKGGRERPPPYPPSGGRGAPGPAATLWGGEADPSAAGGVLQGPEGAASNPPPLRARVGRGGILDFPLGPALDQCCGGHMRVAFAVFGAADLEALRRAPGEIPLWQGGPVLREESQPRTVLIYGAGHVGTALARALAPLPFAVRWIDARLGAFPADLPPGVETVITPLPEAEAKAAPADALHVVLTHSHALDMEIVGAVMERGTFGYLGLIGSATKKALFVKRLRERGIPEARLARLTCPIGVPGLHDKRPAVIAASAAAQLLQVSAAAAAQTARETA